MANNNNSVSSIMILITCFLLGLMLIVSDAQDGIGFPENHGDLSQVPEDERQPLYMPGRCPENELLFPGDQNDDWICDCKPGYIFHPSTTKCHPAYEQGPCGKSQMLVMPNKGFVPVCVPNVCVKNKVVKFEDKCVTLGKPCMKLDTRYVYGVNATSVKVQCLKQPLDYPTTPYKGGADIRDRFMGDDEEITTTPPPTYVVLVGSQNLCAPGCKRRINDTCPKDL